MVFVVETHNMVYAPLPKAGCTSLKAAMYALDHGAAFDGVWKDGKRLGLQQAYPSVQFEAGDFAHLDDPFVFAVVRDPAERVLSTWSERVMSAGRLEIENARMGTGKVTTLMRKLSGQGVARPMDPRPSIETFIHNLDAYAATYRAVRHHVRSAAYYLGGDLSVYDRIYRLTEMAELQDDIRARTGQTDFAIPTRNSSPDAYKVRLDDLSDAAFDALMAWLEPEYELLSQWFDRPRRASQNTQQTGTI